MSKKLTLLLGVPLVIFIAGLGPADTLYAGGPRQGSSITLTLTELATGLPSAEGGTGDQITMRIAADGTSNMAGIQLKVEFDSSVVSIPNGGVIQDQIPEGFFFQSNVDHGGGVATIAVAGAVPVNVSSLTIADVAFDLIGAPGQSSEIAFTGVLAGDASFPPKPIPVTAINGTIRIRIPAGGPTSAPAASGPQPSAAATAVPSADGRPAVSAEPAGPTSTPTPKPSGGFCNSTPASSSPVSGLANVLLLLVPLAIIAAGRGLRR